MPAQPYPVSAVRAGALALLSASASAASPPAVDRWLLDGHGAGRALFAGPAGGAGWTASPPGAPTCSQLLFYTPFSGFEAAAGLAARDAAVPGGALLALPLMCTAAGKAAEPFAWLVDPATGATVAFAHLPDTGSLDSFVKFLPDGSFAVGTNGTAVSVFAADATLALLYRNEAIAAGGGGAQVLAVTRGTPSQAAQLQVAGGTGGPNWWGSAADLPLDAAKLATPFGKAVGNADSTVNMGADGLSMFNNQRFESPAGVTRFTMPFPSSPETYNSGSQQWPWQMRSAFDGRVAALEDGRLSLYSGAKGHARAWVSDELLDNTGPTTLAWLDDESLIIFANTTTFISINAETGASVAIVDLRAAPISAKSCAAQMSPWTIPTPVPEATGRVAFICTSMSGRTAVWGLDAHSGAVSPKGAPLAVAPAQQLADSGGFVYVVGINPATEAIVMQRVAVPASA